MVFLFLALCGLASASVIPRASNSSSTGSTLIPPVASVCGPSSANVVCIDRYGALLPPSFSRDSDPSVGYAATEVPDDDSWALVQSADFVVFNQEKGLKILGDSPTLEKVFDVLNVIHEGPVYDPVSNKLFLCQDGPPGNLSSLVIDLNVDPPTLDAWQSSPPMYQPNGGVLHDGSIYWAVMGNNDSLPNGLIQRPGIAKMNPETLESEMILDNYNGFYFSGPNDLAIDAAGDIWFTDSDYAYGIGLSSVPKQIELATYRFRPSTGEIAVVENSLDHPNGIAFSPDGKTVYITDSGLESVGGTPSRGAGDFYNYPIEILFTSTGKRSIYAFDVVETPAGAYLDSKRIIFQSLEGAPDGLKVATNGYLVAACGLANGVDILDPYGSIVARIQTSHAVENIAFAGPEMKTLWLVGISGISKVEFDLAGPKVS